MTYCSEQPWSPTSEAIMAWDDAFHNLMLNDQLRMDAYRKAIFEVVKPGDVAIDLGVGSGILSQWLFEAGAQKVIGVEMNKPMLQRAVNRLSELGFGQKYTPVNQLSFDVVLPDKVDVLVSEIIGNMGDNENFQPILNDAIERFLRPGGRKIPLSVSSYIAPVMAVHAHRDVSEGRVLSLSANYNESCETRQKRSNSPFDLYYDCIVPKQGELSDPALVCTYTGVWDQPATYDKMLSFRLHRRGTLTGFRAHFVAQLAENTVLDISGGDITVGRTSDSWKHAYLPIETPVDVLVGDVVELAFSRHYLSKSTRAFQQVYGWKGHVRRNGRPIGRFSQSSGVRV